MADQVTIANGTQQLTVSRKAFDAIYKSKGFKLVRAKAVEQAEAGDDDQTADEPLTADEGEEASAPPTAEAAKSKAAAPSAKSKKAGKAEA